MKTTPISKALDSTSLDRPQSTDAEPSPATNTTASSHPVELLREPYPGDPTREIVLLRASFSPGDSTPPHKHPGLVVGYVIRGELEFQLEGEPVRRLSSGDRFYEAPRAAHLVSRNPSGDTTEVLAFIVQEKGARVMIPLNDPAELPD